MFVNTVLLPKNSQEFLRITLKLFVVSQNKNHLHSKKILKNSLEKYFDIRSVHCFSSVSVYILDSSACSSNY